MIRVLLQLSHACDGGPCRARAQQMRQLQRRAELRALDLPGCDACPVHAVCSAGRKVCARCHILHPIACVYDSTARHRLASADAQYIVA